MAVSVTGVPTGALVVLAVKVTTGTVIGLTGGGGGRAGGVVTGGGAAGVVLGGTVVAGGGGFAVAPGTCMVTVTDCTPPFEVTVIVAE